MSKRKTLRTVPHERVLVCQVNEQHERTPANHQYVDCPVRVWLARPLGDRAVIDMDTDEELPIYSPPYLNNVPQPEHGYRLAEQVVDLGRYRGRDDPFEPRRECKLAVALARADVRMIASRMISASERPSERTRHPRVRTLRPTSPGADAS